MSLKKYLEATTRKEKEKMIQHGQKGLEAYRDKIEEVNINKSKLSEDILNRLPKFWINSALKNKSVIYEEDIINHCQGKIHVNKTPEEFYFRAIAVNGGNTYFTNGDSGILHYILVIYLILIGVLPKTEDILDWHKQNDVVSTEVLNKFIAIDLFDEGGERYVMKLSGSYSPNSKIKVRKFINQNNEYKNMLDKFNINHEQIII